MSPVKECGLKAQYSGLSAGARKGLEAFVEEMQHVKTRRYGGHCLWPDPIQRDLLDLPKYGCVNIHASLLPKYRGAAPIQWAVINGDEETGITTMMMDVETGYRRYAGENCGKTESG